MDGLDLQDPLVSTDWLVKQINQEHVRIVDASWRLPGTKTISAIEAYKQRHIPGAVHFDIDEISDPDSPHPHMAPSPEIFNQAMARFGIKNDDIVIIYDDAGIFSAPRVWWTFRAMGHEHVFVLDGGLPKWIEQSYPLTDHPPTFDKTTYEAKPIHNAYIDHHTIRDALAKGIAVLDARPKARFEGKAPEPREGLRSGHMPGAISLPVSDLMNKDKTLKSKAALAKLFHTIDPQTGAFTTCGSGVTAAVINLALERLSYMQKGLYDGSWAEWGALANDASLFPISKT